VKVKVKERRAQTLGSRGMEKGAGRREEVSLEQGEWSMEKGRMRTIQLKTLC
jgi:hypothetical protein